MPIMAHWEDHPEHCAYCHAPATYSLETVKATFDPHWGTLNVTDNTGGTDYVCDAHRDRLRNAEGITAAVEGLRDGTRAWLLDVEPFYLVEYPLPAPEACATCGLPAQWWVAGVIGGLRDDGSLWVGDAADSDTYCEECIAGAVGDARADYAMNYWGGMAHTGNGLTAPEPVIVAQEPARIGPDADGSDGTVWSLWLTEPGGYYGANYVGVHAITY